VVSGKVEADNVRVLHRNIAPVLQKACNDFHLRESSSQQSIESLKNADEEVREGMQKTTRYPLAILGTPLLSVNAFTIVRTFSNQRTYVELPFNTKFLLIAAYLASYNPVKSDKRFFMKHHGKQRKTKASIHAKEARTTSQLTGPQTFPLDRLMAIFYSINDQVAPSASIQSQLTSLVTLQFLIQVSSEEALDEPKYRCNVGLDFIEQIAKTVEFEIRRYLFDFV
jgi:origin recognition complex subunit 5